MKRKVTATILAAVMAAGLATPAFADTQKVSYDGYKVTTTKSVTETANPTSSTIYVDGQAVAFEAYNINGNNYFKLRDVAWALSGTSKQFNVEWNDTEKVINLVSGKEYGKNGKLTTGDGVIKSATINSAPIMVDGEYVDMMAYNINGNNYFKLRDLGTTFNFAVGWNGDANAVSISTTGEIEEIAISKDGNAVHYNPTVSDKKDDNAVEEVVAENNVRWDLISTEYCTTTFRSGSEIGLPEYMLIVDHPYMGFNVIDARTGYKYVPGTFNGTLKLNSSDYKEIMSVPSEYQVFKEGDIHSIPKIGDTVIKADGSKIILTGAFIGDNYCTDLVVGYGQGTNIVLGTSVNGRTITEDKMYDKYGVFYTESGLTGECYLTDTWSTIMNHTHPIDAEGDYDGQVKNIYWKWDANAWHPENGKGDWRWIADSEISTKVN